MLTDKVIYEFIFREDFLNDNNLITEENINKLQGETYFKQKSVVGQRMLHFMLQERCNEPKDNNVPFSSPIQEDPIMVHYTFKISTIMYPLEFEAFISRFMFYRFNRLPMFVSKSIV